MGKTRENVAEKKLFLAVQVKLLNCCPFTVVFTVLYIKRTAVHNFTFQICYHTYLVNINFIHENYLVRVFKLRELKSYTIGFRNDYFRKFSTILWIFKSRVLCFKSYFYVKYQRQFQNKFLNILAFKAKMFLTRKWILKKISEILRVKI